MRTSLALCAAAILTVACQRETQFHGTALDAAESPEFVFERPNAKPFNLTDQKGSVVLIFFGYTHCPDICPTTLADWKRVKTALGDDAKKFKFVFVSVDSERDTATIPQSYAQNFDADFIGLSADSSNLSSVYRDFGVSAFRDNAPDVTGDPEKDAENWVYTMSHSSQTFVVDRDGRLRLIFRYGMAPEKIVDDLKKLI